jgi:hypothetical protein
MSSFQIAYTNNSLIIVQTIVVYAIVMHCLFFWRYFATWALSNACPSCMWLCRRKNSASQDLKLEELLLMRRAVGVYWCIFHCCTLSRVITIEKGTLLWLFWWVVGNLPNFLYSVTEGVYLLLWTFGYYFLVYLLLWTFGYYFLYLLCYWCVSCCYSGISMYILCSLVYIQLIQDFFLALVIITPGEFLVLPLART